jgi:hypothetical protein
MAKFILYLIPLVFSVWILTSVFTVLSHSVAPWYARTVTGGIFVLFILIWWWATITVVGPVF